MPKTPKGHKRPADVASNAVRVMRIATGEIEESPLTDSGKDKGAVALGRKGGLARAEKLTAPRSHGRALHGVLQLDEDS